MDSCRNATNAEMNEEIDDTMLARAEFLDVVRLTPLIAIDLIAVDDRGRVLLGRRVNRPALNR
jgi:hypothetical protein